jgi:hypothetical protein
MSLMSYTLIAGLLLTIPVAGWRPPTWLWSVTLLWGILNYPHARALILGQMATVVFLALTVALLALDQGHDWWAGALLAVATIKPQMSFLLIPWVLWWSAWRQRWQVWKGFALAMTLLVGASFLLVPTWAADFLQDVLQYDVISGTEYQSLTWIVTRHLLRLGPVVESLGLALFSLYALLEIWRGRRAKWDAFVWTTGLLLILTHFIAPRTATTHYTMLLLPLFAWFAHLREQLGKQAQWAVLGAEAVLFFGQWVIFIATLQGDYETALVYLPFPVLMLLIHLTYRHNVQWIPVQRCRS